MSLRFDLAKQSIRRLAYRAIGKKPVNHDTFSRDEITEFVHHMMDKLKPSG